MPRIPEIKTLTSTSVDILNAIRNSATINYQDYVPLAEPNADSIKEIGAIIMDYPALQNEFLSALVNRIGRVLVTSKMYDNPLASFKKGLLEFGETIEEIFVNLAKPHQFDPAVAETEIFKREKPDVKSAFHIMNYQKFYKTTVSNDQLRQAFLSWQGITDLIAKIVDSMYTSANYDEFLTMKYMIAVNILDGKMLPVEIPTVAKNNMHDIVSEIKGTSNSFEFLSRKYNKVGVYTHSKKNDQYMLVNTKFDATMDVEVLASAFNMSKVEFMGHRVLIDSFGELDVDRLDILFENDTTYRHLTPAQLEALDAIPAIIVDKDWFMVFDNYYNFTEKYNSEGLYWNYWYHCWKTFSVSPFANNAIFVPGEPAVTDITVAPATVTVSAGQRVQFTADVETAYFAPKTVDWSINTGDTNFPNTYITKSGLLVIDPEDTNSGYTVTAKSVFDGTVVGTATVTLA